MIMLITNVFGTAKAEQVFATTVVADIAKAEQQLQIAQKKLAETKEQIREEEQQESEVYRPGTSFERDLQESVAPERLEYLQNKAGENWEAQRQLAESMYDRLGS